MPSVQVGWELPTPREEAIAFVHCSSSSRKKMDAVGDGAPVVRAHFHQLPPWIGFLHLKLREGGTVSYQTQRFKCDLPLFALVRSRNVAFGQWSMASRSAMCSLTSPPLQYSLKEQNLVVENRKEHFYVLETFH